MGFIDDINESREADRKTEYNKNLAQRKADRFKQSIVDRYSEYGEVIELEDGEKLLGKNYCHCGQGLGYRRLDISINYESYYTTTESSTYQSGYSGTIDSSGSVDLTPTYNTYSYQVTEKKDSAYRKNYYIKPIEKGTKNMVIELENKFFANGGDLYSRLKNNEILHREYVDIQPKSYFTKICNARRAISIILLFALLVSFAVFDYMLFVSNVEDMMYPVLVLVALAVIAIVMLVIYNRASEQNKYFDIEDRLCFGFVVGILVFILVSCIVFLNFYVLFVTDEGSVFIAYCAAVELISIILSIIFIIKCSPNNGKNISARMLKLINDEDKLKELENLAVEIDSYTKKEAYGLGEADFYSEGNDKDHNKNYYFIK